MPTFEIVGISNFAGKQQVKIIFEYYGERGKIYRVAKTVLV
jgi:hypothetical protein